LEVNAYVMTFVAVWVLINYLGDSVGDLLEVDTESELGSNSSEGVAGRLGSESGGTGKTGVDLHAEI
jgi:hypothetical protein